MISNREVYKTTRLMRTQNINRVRYQDQFDSSEIDFRNQPNYIYDLSEEVNQHIDLY